MLEEPRQLDFGITDIVYDWAQGESLSQVLYGTDLTGGDFVRNGKRLADVLQQIAVAGPYLADRAETLAPVANRRTIASIAASSHTPASTKIEHQADE